MKHQNKAAFQARTWSVILVLGILLIIFALFFIPWNIGDLSSNPDRVQNYDQAVQRIEAIRSNRAPEMNPDCLLQFMTHGQKVQRVMILVHGYTNCPAQFRELGQRFYEIGYNILIAPLPHHGLADRLTDEQGQLTAEELAAYADEVIAIASGLGDQVTMMGISGGGITTAWAAQNRADLDLAVIISPAFGFEQIPTLFTAPAMNISLLLPDSFEWWDPSLKTQIDPPHAYPRYSRHALAQIMRLGFAVQVNAQKLSPRARKILVITNANDRDVNNSLTALVVEKWRRQGAQISTYEFPAHLELGHDLIDPMQPDQRTDIVYPQLIDLITK